MTAVDYRIFDDLLIGNFVKAVAHGPWGRRGNAVLYPDVAPYIAKFSDNGGARTAAELRAYFGEYRRRGYFGFGLTPAAALERAMVERF